MSAPPFLFCFGLGFSARALARRLLDRGWQVAGTSRTPREDLPPGITAFRFDDDRPLDPQTFAGATHILCSIPPGEAGDPVLAAHGADLVRTAPAWVGYLSTTGVYGDHAGGLVDETAALTPSGPRGRRRVDAERGWLALGLPVQIFRLAGIYGPGRNALETVRSGRAQRVVKPGQVFSRVHVEDIAAVLEASIARPRPGAAYNVADDDPAPPQEVIEHACRLLGVEPPAEIPFEQAALSPMARSFYDDNKRVDNSRIKTDLGVRLRYPSYRAGLAALLAEGSG